MESYFLKILKNSMTTEFVFENESHTLGNLIQNELLKNQNVLVAAYKIEHPLKNKMSMAIMTDGQDPKEVLYTAVTDLQETVENLLKINPCQT